MSYTALYRKFRPSTFDEVKGQEHIVQTLKNQYGFFNYFIDTKELKNRNPGEHKQIKELEKEGKVLVIGNSGTQVNVWYRKNDKII